MRDFSHSTASCNRPRMKTKQLLVQRRIFRRAVAMGGERRDRYSSARNPRVRAPARTSRQRFGSQSSPVVGLGHRAIHSRLEVSVVLVLAWLIAWVVVAVMLLASLGVVIAMR